VIDWNPVIEPKFVEQALLQSGLFSHHPSGPPTVLMVDCRIPGQGDLLGKFLMGIIDACTK
jgi:hypothetical protein